MEVDKMKTNNQTIAKALEDIAKGFGALAQAVKEQDTITPQPQVFAQKTPEAKEVGADTDVDGEDFVDMPERPVWVTFGVLGFLIFVSFVTGVSYWWSSYFRPVSVVPVAATVLTENEPVAIIEPIHEPAVLAFDGVVMDPRPEFVALWEQYDNTSIVARVYIEGTGIDVIVVQDEPNEQWPIVMDANVNLLVEDQNTVIYDHSAYAFQNVLHNYMEYDFFLQHPIIALSTLYEISRWEVFSFYVAPANFPFAVVNQNTSEQWADTIMQFSLASWYNTRIDVTYADRVLTLATQSTNNPDLSYVLHARLYREITS